MRIFLCFLFSCLIYAAKAQQNVVEKYIGWKWRDSKMKIFSNGQNTWALILRRDSIKAVLLDSNQHFVKDFSFSTHSLVMNCSGSFIKEDNIFIYFEDLHNDDLHAVAINTQTGVITENVIAVNLKKNKLLSRISSSSHVIYFTVNKKSDDFVIYDFKDETHFDTIHFEANPHMWKSLRYKTESWGPSAINVVRIDTDGKQKYETLSCLHKLYFRDNSLLLLSSTLAGTMVTEFDLASKQMTPHIIQHTTDNTLDSAYTFNSFLFNDKVYFVSTTNSALHVRIADLVSGEVVKEYYTNSDDEITFKNTALKRQTKNDNIPIAMNVSTTMNGPLRMDVVPLMPLPLRKELKKSKQLIRKMVAHQAVIDVFYGMIPDQLNVFIGSYKVAYSGAFIPKDYTGFSFAQPSYTEEISFGFNAIFDEKTNEHIPGDLGKTINESVEEFSKKLKIPDYGYVIYRNRGSYFFAYYDTKKKEFNVVKF